MFQKYINGVPLRVLNGSNHSISRDFWSLLLIPFIIGLLTVSYFPGLSKLMILYGFLLAGAFSLYFVYHRLNLQPEVIIYFAWVMWSLSGAFVAIDRSLYLQRLFTVVQVGILLFLISGVISLKRNISAIMFSIIIGNIIVLLTSFYTGEFLVAAEAEKKIRVEGLVGNANGFAYNMMFMVYAVFYFWKSKSSVHWRIFLIFLLALSAIGIIYSGSRTGIIGFTIFILLWWYFCHKKTLPKNPIRMYIILIILLIGIYYSANYVFSNTYIGKRIQYIEHFEDSSSQTRLQLYKDSFDVIIHNPIFGVGLSNFVLFSPSGENTHSNYLEVASNTGIVGFFLYYALYFILWRRLVRIKRLYKEPHFSYTISLLKVVIIIMLIQSFTTVNYFSKITWIFLATVVGYSWALEQNLLRLKSYLSIIKDN
ncbi:MAG: O-antigen ligase family protein [bacterium]